MTLTWYGHSCFLVETESARVVLDPYEPGSVPGLALPALTADLVLCSHGHHDHCWADGVTLSGKPAGCTVAAVETFHDEVQGAKRGTNRIHILDFDGVRVVHLGDLGHVLTPEQAAAVGRPDVLLIPVGGYYTIDPAEAKQVTEQLQPKVIIPMHYRGAGFGYEEIGPVAEFTKLFDRVQTVPGSTVTWSPELSGVILPETPKQN